MDYPLRWRFKIGLFQCLALVPGVSRSGATIVGAMLLGTDKRSAAEFSFFLAMPTMAGAFAYDLYKNCDDPRPRRHRAASPSASSSPSSRRVIVVRYLLDFVAAPRLRAVRLVAHHRRRRAIGALLVLGTVERCPA